jgi:hypothetical protein
MSGSIGTSRQGTGMQGADLVGAIADSGLVRVRPIGVCATCYAIVGITEDLMYLIDVDGCQCEPVWGHVVMLRSALPLPTLQPDSNNT